MRINPEIIAAEVADLSKRLTFEELVTLYLDARFQLVEATAIGEWLDALATAYRNDDDDAWTAEQIAKDRMNTIKKEIMTKYL
jgi:hypothetical protein